MWEEIGLLETYAPEPAYDFTEAFGLAIAHKEGSLFEVTKDGINFEILAPFPNTDVETGVFGNNDDGCLVVLDDKNVFLAGGRIESDDPDVFEDFSPRAFLYNRDEDEWTEVASMPQGRKLHSCGVVDSFGGYQVIVAGADESYCNADACCESCADGPRESSVGCWLTMWVPLLLSCLCPIVLILSHYCPNLVSDVSPFCPLSRF